MFVEVLKAGLATSIQDKGRLGFAVYGVPESGAMDSYGATLANLLTGNKEDVALLEITLIGPKLFFDSAALVAVSGIAAEVYLNGAEVALNEAFLVPEKGILEIKRVTKGKYVYLAVSGGFQPEIVMKSRSMYKGITVHSFLKKKDKIPLITGKGEMKETHSVVRFEKERYDHLELQVFPGPEFTKLPHEVKQSLLDRLFTLSSDSNRMAYLFEEEIQSHLQPILTGPVLPGTVQLTPGGKIIVLMRDGQVTGGYPRVLQLSNDSINQLAQKRTKERVRFAMDQ